jgi:hypothetical protein
VEPAHRALVLRLQPARGGVQRQARRPRHDQLGRRPRLLPAVRAHAGELANVPSVLLLLLTAPRVRVRNTGLVSATRRREDCDRQLMRASPSGGAFVLQPGAARTVGGTPNLGEPREATTRHPRAQRSSLDRPRACWPTIGCGEASRAHAVTVGRPSPGGLRA